jgi:hypothetical protein
VSTLAGLLGFVTLNCKSVVMPNRAADPNIA